MRLTADGRRKEVGGAVWCRRPRPFPRVPPLPLPLSEGAAPSPPFLRVPKPGVQESRGPASAEPSAQGEHSSLANKSSLVRDKASLPPHAEAAPFSRLKGDRMS